MENYTALVLTGILWYCECPLCRYPESWRGTASCTAPLRREYVYWTNPGRYYRYQYPHVTSILMSNIYPWCRYQTFYPSYRYTPRYRTRFYRWSRDTWHVTGWRFSLCVFLCPFDLNNKYILPLQSKVSYWDFFKSTECQAKLFTLGYLLFCRLLLMQIAKSGTFLKNSGNLLHDRHKNFENRFRNSWDNWGQS